MQPISASEYLKKKCSWRYSRPEGFFYHAFRICEYENLSILMMHGKQYVPLLFIVIQQLKHRVAYS